MVATTTDDTLDPERVLASLPDRDRGQFLTEYREAAEAAAADITRYRELRWLLHTWHLRGLARSRPGYEEGRQQARAGQGEYVSLDEVVRRRRGA